MSVFRFKRFMSKPDLDENLDQLIDDKKLAIDSSEDQIKQTKNEAHEQERILAQKKFILEQKQQKVDQLKLEQEKSLRELGHLENELKRIESMVTELDYQQRTIVHSSSGQKTLLEQKIAALRTKEQEQKQEIYKLKHDWIEEKKLLEDKASSLQMQFQLETEQLARLREESLAYSKEMMRKIHDLQKTLQEKESESNHLKKVLSSKQDSYEETFEILNKKVEALEQEINDQEEKIYSLRHIELLDKRFQEKSKILEQKKQSLNELREKRASLELRDSLLKSDVQNAIEQSKSLELESITLQESVKELKYSVLGQEKSMQKMRRSIEDSKLSINDLKAVKYQYEKALKEAQEKNLILVQMRSEICQEASNIEQELNIVKDELRIAEETSSQNERDVALKLQEIEKHSKELENLNYRFKKAKQQQDALDSEKVALEEKTLQINYKIAGLRLEIRKHKRYQDALKQKLVRSKTEVTYLQDYFNKRQQALADLNKKNIELNQKIEEAFNDRNQLVSKSDLLQEQIEAAKSKIDAKTIETSKYQNEVMALTEAVATKDLELSLLADNMARLSQLQESSISERKNLERRREEQNNREIEQLAKVSELEERNAEIEQSNKSAIEQEKLTQLSICALEQKAQDLQIQNKNKNFEYSNIQEILATLLLTKQKAETVVSKLKEEEQDFHKKIQSMRNEVEVLRHAVEEKEKEIAILSTKIPTLKATSSTYRDQRSELLEKLTSLEKQEGSLQKTVDGHKSEVQSMLADISKIKQQLNNHRTNKDNFLFLKAMTEKINLQVDNKKVHELFNSKKANHQAFISFLRAVAEEKVYVEQVSIFEEKENFYVKMSNFFDEEVNVRMTLENVASKMIDTYGRDSFNLKIKYQEAHGPLDVTIGFTDNVENKSRSVTSHQL